MSHRGASVLDLGAEEGVDGRNAAGSSGAGGLPGGSEGLFGRERGLSPFARQSRGLAPGRELGCSVRAVLSLGYPSEEEEKERASLSSPTRFEGAEDPEISRQVC